MDVSGRHELRRLVASVRAVTEVVRRWMDHAMPKGHWVYLFAAFQSLMVLDIVCQTIRILSVGSVDGPISFVDHMRSDVLFYTAFVVGVVGAFMAVRTSWLRFLMTVLMHVVLAAMFVFAVAGYGYFITTGSRLNLDVVVTTIKHFGETRVVIESVAGPLFWLILICVIGITVGFPIFAARHEEVRRLWVLPEPYRSRPRSVNSCMLVVAIVVSSLVVSVLPNLSGTTAFTRNRYEVMAVDALRKLHGSTPAGFVQPTALDIPNQAHLAATSATKKRNVVIIFLESTSAGATSLYNLKLQTTPFLESLGAQSLVANNAYTVVPHTSKSLVAGLCGVEPPFDSHNTESTEVGHAARCLPSLLSEQGYRTAYFQSATEDFERRRSLVKKLHFDEFFPLESFPKEGFSKANYFGYEDDIMLGPSSDWAASHSDRPFLMTFLTVTTHHNYVVPKGFETEKIVKDGTKNRYLNAVRYEDRFVERLVGQFKALGLYDNTDFVILGDHGEGFGEHRLKQHDDTPYEEGIKIPLIIHSPDRFPDGAQVSKPVQNLALLPTIADLLGFRIDGGRYPAASLLADQPARPVNARCFHEARCLVQIDGTNKYIHHFGLRPDEYFDLAKDPGEKHNIIKEQAPAHMARIKQDLLVWEAEVKATYKLARAS